MDVTGGRLVDDEKSATWIRRCCRERSASCHRSRHVLTDTVACESALWQSGATKRTSGGLWRSRRRAILRADAGRPGRQDRPGVPTVSRRQRQEHGHRRALVTGRGDFYLFDDSLSARTTPDAECARARRRETMTRPDQSSPAGRAPRHARQDRGPRWGGWSPGTHDERWSPTRPTGECADPYHEQEAE